MEITGEVYDLLEGSRGASIARSYLSCLRASLLILGWLSAMMSSTMLSRLLPNLSALMEGRAAVRRSTSSTLTSCSRDTPENDDDF